VFSTTAILDGDTYGVVSLAGLNDSQWNSLTSDDTKDVCNANNAAVAAGRVAVGLTLIITAGSVGVRFTGATDEGAAGDALAPYPSFTTNISLPLRGMRDRSASPMELLTRVSLRPVSATGYALIQWATAHEAG
jgi:hypothetical protein